MSGRKIKIRLLSETVVVTLDDRGEELFQNDDDDGVFADHLADLAWEVSTPIIDYWDEV